MFEAYGGRCGCCGESVALFLHVERVRRDASDPPERDRSLLWRRLMREGWPDTYELTCANCSLGKAVQGTCPHRRTGMVLGDE